MERTRKITRAMEAVASTQLKKIEKILTPAQNYLDNFTEILREIYLNFSSQPNIWFEKKSEDKFLFLIIGSERGLCGAFNVNLINLLQKTISEIERDGRKVIEIIPLGKKLSSYCKKHFGKEGISHYIGREEEVAQELTEKLIPLYLKGEVENVFLLSTLYRKAGGQKFNQEKLLPLEFESTELKVRDYILEPDWETLLAELVPQYLKAKIYSRLVESRASEELSRMLAMKYATDNADEIIEELTLKYHRARQAQITRELLEITQSARRIW